MCLAYPEVCAVAQFCSIGAEFKNVRFYGGSGLRFFFVHDLTKRTALFEFMMLKLNREVLGQVPSICHLVNFGAMTNSDAFVHWR